MTAGAGFTCDQAIFTSIRTPMGEGYRIVAASRGVRPGEKQAITRNSPSHDALCRTCKDTGEEKDAPFGAAFYELPGGRLCVALSCNAGAEHTGRGGERVYTHNLIIERDDLARCSFNPFVILRAMLEQGLSTPQLKPRSVMPQLQMSVSASARRVRSVPVDQMLSPVWRCGVLQLLLDRQSLVVNIASGWLDAAETLLMGVPGPMRVKLSLSAGLRFSVGRCHNLFLTSDDQKVIKSRIAGHPVAFFSQDSPPNVEQRQSAWVSFVERHWNSGEIDTLAQRTSKPFTDINEGGRERVGRLYNRIDAVRQTGPGELLAHVGEYLGCEGIGIEAELSAEYVIAAQNALLQRLMATSWSESQTHWVSICELGKRCTESFLFVKPLAEKILGAAMREDPPAAARAALDLVRDVPPATALAATHLIEAVLSRLEGWARHASDADLNGLGDVCRIWQSVRPDCPIVQRISERCSAAAASG